MILTLRMTADGGGLREERRLEYGTLTVGRGAENDWVLTDAERTLSKQHCRFDQSGDGFLLTDLSTNGVFVNGEPQPLGRGRSRPLADGDTIVLGPFHLAASIGTAPIRPASSISASLEPPIPGSIPAAHDPVEPAPPRRDNEFVPFSGIQHTPGSPIPLPATDPWLEEIPGGDFGPDRHVRPQGWETPIDPAAFSASGQRAADHPLDPAPIAFSQTSEHVPATSTVMKLPAAQSVLPTDWNDVDPLAGVELAPTPFDLVAPPPPLPPPAAAAPLDPSAITIPNEELLAVLDGSAAQPISAPDEPTPTVTVHPVPVAAPPSPGEREPLQDAVSGYEHLAGVQTIEHGASALEPEEEFAPPPAFEPPPPPTIVALPQAAETPAVQVSSPSPAPGRIGVLAAFLEGAGLTPDALAGMRPEEAARDIGRLVRAAVEGAREILATRAMVKSELRVDQTIIQATDNNAMKFAPDVQRCLAAMVGKPPTGFLPGSAAMAQSMDDIKRHELAMIAALNSVFAAMTERLDPDTISAKVRAENSLGTFLPYAREARCWAVYLETHAALQATEAENTAGSLLAPLASAYARQLRRTE